MSEILGGLYSLGNRAKRQLRDLFRDPSGYVAQTSDEIRRRMRDEPEKVVMETANFGPLGSLAGVVKPKGGNWLSGSVEDALRGLKQQGYNDVNPEVDSLNRFIEGPLTKYVKTRMASPEDEVRKLAEQGVLHFEPAMIRERSPLMEKVVGRRETAGFPIQGIADAPLARNWENTSDSIIRNLEARDLSSAERAASFGGKSNIPGDTIVYEMNPFASGAGISDLGFPHLIDELSNAINPASGLPRNLQLTPEAMKQLSMEKAVRRVAEINAWRAAQKIEANRKLAEQAALVREYAENNPKGLRWVELKASEGKAPENFKPLFPGQTPEDAARAASNKALADQLKYEGDVMQNCVGGYCDDVLSGRSRIFSLRDAKGEPHVTVEVAPQPRNVGDQDIPDRYLDEAMEKLGIDTPEGQWGREEEIDKLAGDLWRKDNPGVNRIVQIKGKQNKAPKEEYLPFVQDFVRNSPLGSPWSDVGDLGNAGLRKLPDNRFVTNQQFDEAIQRLTGEGEPSVNAEWFARQIRNDPKWWENAKDAFEGFASGGSVSAPKGGWDIFAHSEL